MEDEIAKGVSLTESLEIQIKEQCQEAIREILTKYTYHTDKELKRSLLLLMR